MPAGAQTARGLYHALLKATPAASLPPALQGSKTQSARLSAGSRSHHAVGAVEIGNGEAIVCVDNNGWRWEPA